MAVMSTRGTLAVVGLGYVGLPLAVLAKEKGWTVLGYDVDREKVNRISRGEIPFADDRLHGALAAHPVAATTDPVELQRADVLVVAVPTPVDDAAHPDLHPLTSALETVAKHARRGALVSIESTVNPGVCDEVVIPLLHAHGRAADGEDLALVHCPERVNPGDSRWSIRNIPRILGGVNQASTDRGVAFYETILEAPVRRMSSVRAAEAVKITENVFRDINIAFVNELARSFDRLGIDVQEVIAGAATKPFAFMAHSPGCGVGGHCIPVDPYYLIEHAQRQGFDHLFLRLARQINKGMPRYAVDRLIEAFHDAAGSTPAGGLRGVRVALLGLAYKRDIDDIRESPALDIREILQEEGAIVVAYDPHVPARSSVGSLREALERAEAVLVATDHTVFRDLALEDFAGTPVRVVVDGRNCLPLERFVSSGILYRGIGRGLSAQEAGVTTGARAAVEATAQA